MITISVIVGSTRQGRFSEKPAQWILQHLQKRNGIEARLLDLRDFPMPFFDQAVSPATPGRAPYENEVVKRWTAAIAASDGFVFVTPEYNYGPSAVLKNAIDWVYPEWNRKAAAFVSYGSALGARSVQQLREVAIELQIAPVRSSVHIPVATLWAHFKGGDVGKGLAELETQAQRMIDDLLWWTTALTAARKTEQMNQERPNPMSDMKSHDKTATRPQTPTLITQSRSPHRQTDAWTRSRGRSTINVALWIVQGLLAALFLLAGGAKLVLPLDQLTGPVALPGWFLRFIGAAEVLGALGLVLPGLLRIRPGLTPLAAAGLVIIMIGATVVMWVGGVVPVALMNVVVALLAAFVAYGRWRLAP